MKQKLCTIFLLIFSLAPPLITAETIRYENQDFSISENSSIIKSNRVTTNLAIGNLSLPSQTVYIHIGNLDNPNFSYTISATEIFGHFDTAILKDTPTSLMSSSIKPSVLTDKLGTEAIINQGTVSVGVERYLKVLMFPVTYNSSGDLILNQSISIYLDQETVEKQQILSIEQFRNLLPEVKTEPVSRSASTGSIYLIITDTSLFDAFKPLAVYRNSVGISTEVVLIEDILPLYSGRDDAEKLREYLKSYYTDGGEYLLLGGDETILPIRYTYPNIATTEIDLENQQVCDLYFADLTGDWNLDNDNVWGEKYTDSVDLTPELKVGRLPFNNPTEVSDYIHKLIDYETNRNRTDLSYLTRSFFFSSDQMRDYDDVGQHNLIARAFPDHYTIDTSNGIEHSRGDDPSPTNKSPEELLADLSEGFGMINIIAHGSSSTFAVRTANYNEWPKAYFMTDTNVAGHGTISDIAQNGKVSFYASLGCDNAAFDKDQPPFNQISPNMAQTLLAMPQSGAVGLVGNTRWGWVSSSHLLQRRLFEYIFANPNRPVVEAMNLMKDDYYFYRDLIYSINYFGDPTLVLHTSIPDEISLSLDYQQNAIAVYTASAGTPLARTDIIISENDAIVGFYETDDNGMVFIEDLLEFGSTYTFSAVKENYLIKQKEFTPSIATDIDDSEVDLLPSEFRLHQNYPNPFNPATTITFSLPTGSNVRLAVYNILGQQVSLLTDKFYSAGSYELIWDSHTTAGNESASGIYFYRIETDSVIEMKKMVLLR